MRVAAWRGSPWTRWRCWSARRWAAPSCARSPTPATGGPSANRGPSRSICKFALIENRSCSWQNQKCSGVVRYSSKNIHMCHLAIFKQGLDIAVEYQRSKAYDDIRWHRRNDDFGQTSLNTSNELSRLRVAINFEFPAQELLPVTGLLPSTEFPGILSPPYQSSSSNRTTWTWYVWHPSRFSSRPSPCHPGPLSVMSNQVSCCKWWSFSASCSSDDSQVLRIKTIHSSCSHMMIN